MMCRVLLFVACLCLFLPVRPACAQTGQLGYADLSRVLERVLTEHPRQCDRLWLTRAALRGFVQALQPAPAGAVALLGLDLESTPPEGLRTRLEAALQGRSPSERSRAWQAAIAAALAALDDPGTRFYPPGTYQQSLEELGYTLGGVGFFVDEEPDAQGGFPVIQMIEGFPAERLGIRPGDRLVEVGGKSTVGMTFAELAGRVRGPVGTSVQIGTRRGAGEITRHLIVREWLNPNPKGAESRLVNGMAYLRLKYLGMRTDLDLRGMLDTLIAQGAKGIILDLRNCPGEMAGSGPVLGLFLPGGRVGYLVVSRQGREPVLLSREKQPYTLPLVVLINAYSGDAAAVVAGSLRDHFRAILIGEATNPKEMKAYKWAAEPLSDGSVASLTTAYYGLPRGQMLPRGALLPDIEVKGADRVAEANGGPDDTAFFKALEFLQAQMR